MDILATYGGTPAEFRENFRVTRMVQDTDIVEAQDMIVEAYAVPYLGGFDDPFTAVVIDPDTQEEVTELDAAEHAKLVFALNCLTFARLLMSQLYRTEYTTAQPTKLNANVANEVELARQIAQYRRFGIAVCLQWRKKALGDERRLPDTIHILNDGI